MKVRRATARDVVPLLASMQALAVFEGYAADFRVTGDDLLVRGLAGTGAKQFTALVAEDEHGALCGHAVLLVTPFTYDLRPTVVLKELYVDARRRRQGVAEALLVAVRAEAQAIGAGRIRWLVLPGNAAAQRLYARWGGAPDTAWESWELRLGDTPR
ncbi:GNAT family N-acetyltransferase [Piscinibacter gummiphilus]|uniref:GNAT family N-acetyltransferase n=1 Tax=Piscinibacter gummiphilus TaxID=946333 RepID=A0ABZ0CU11_9BURK|nr:GNAT family N-acetyltransferase [Piscinibacter gummiphilus]WOB08467.1 GNAT family N-acetyltransferase [Piscinibacter gummiphilus]